MRKVLILSLLAIFFALGASAQSFFKPLPKPGLKSLTRIDGIEQPTVQNAFRPVANVAAYGIPGNIILTGAGISYQHLVYDYNSMKWNCIWSINALGWLSATPDPNSPTPNVITYGLAGGFLNNLIMVGAGFNGSNIIGTIGIGVSLNN